MPPRKRGVWGACTRMHFPRRVPAPAEDLQRYSRESHQGHCHGTAPSLQERVQKVPGPLPSRKNTSWLGAALIASPQYFLPAQDHLCFRVQSMVLTSPGRGALPGRTYINPPTLWLLEDKVWDGGSGSSRMAPAWHLPSSGLSLASQACPDVSHRQKVWTPLTGRW